MIRILIKNAKKYFFLYILSLIYLTQTPLSYAETIKENHKESANLKQEVYPKVCKPGINIGPNGKYGVYVFCDDASGTSIGLININDRNFSQELSWDLHRRFWQEEDWARDVNYVEWSKDGLNLKIVTGDIYGTGNIYLLDLRQKKILSVSSASKNAK